MLPAFQNLFLGIPWGVQWLGLCSLAALGQGSIHGWEAAQEQAPPPKKPKKPHTKQQKTKPFSIQHERIKKQNTST